MGVLHSCGRDGLPGVYALAFSTSSILVETRARRYAAVFHNALHIGSTLMHYARTREGCY